VPPSQTYEQLRSSFAWRLPQRCNIGVACADAQPPGDLALVEVVDSSQHQYTFGDLSRLSNRLASGLAGIGVRAGDRVGIVLPQGLEAGLTHLAVYKLGAIAVPLSGLFGPDALRYRLSDCGAKVVVTDDRAVDRVAEVAADLGDLCVVVAAERTAAPHQPFADLLTAAVDFTPAATGPDTPALLIYTSGTTGAPKGALHGHRVLAGHLPGYELMYEHLPQGGDRIWTPADWAWIGGLMDALLPAWYHGCTVIAATRPRFDPQWAARLLADQGVTAAFLPPTALKLMRQAGVEQPRGLALRAVMSGGEALGEQMLDWGRQQFGVTINEIYGQTEANLLVGNCSSSWAVRPGSMGRPYPGHDVVVLRADATPAPPGEVGEIALRLPDPVAFLGYWDGPEATAEKTRDGWLWTGDLGSVDDDGWLWFGSRADDVIISAGYRIGPGEIEECLLTHPAVGMAAAIGIPDEIRGEVVKAFIKLADGHEPSAGLEDEIAGLVRQRLAAYEYPRQIEFVDELPLTTTGKIRRLALRQREASRRTSHQGAQP
jgi:acetyl-CoA synthetase